MTVEKTGTAIVIVNYGDPGLVAANVGPDVAGQDLQVVLVDNFHSASTRTSAEKLCRERDWVFVASPNDGFGAGVNRGVEAARARGFHTFITLNPDAIATATTLRELGRMVRETPETLVSPYMVSSAGHPHFRGSTVSMRTGRIRTGWVPEDDDPEWKNWLSGACLAFSAEAYDRLKGFSEEFFLYWEDVDISRRAASSGMHLALREDLMVIHDEGGTQQETGARAKSPTYYFYNIRNRMLFGRHLLRGKAWARWALATPRESLRIWMRGGRRQAFTEPRGVWAAIRGVAAGAAFLFRKPPQKTQGQP